MDFRLPESPHFRNVVAILMGLMVSAAVVGTVEMLGQALFPTPAELDLGNAEELGTFLATAPAHFLMFVVCGWFLGIFCGCFVSGVLGGHQGVVCAMVTGLVHASMVILLLMQLPTPMWFRMAGVLVLVPGGWLGWRCSDRLLAYWQTLERESPSPGEK